MEPLLLQLQIDVSLVILLLILPVISTWVSIARHIVGLRTLNIIITLVLTLSFYQFGLIENSFRSDPLAGLKIGILMLAIVFATTVVSYGLIKNWALQYYPKLTIVLTSVVLVLATLLILAAKLGITGLISVNIFTVLLIALLAERLMNLLSRKSLKYAFNSLIETVIIAASAYVFVSWYDFQNLLINYPYVIILVLPINYFLGRFTGLRFTEYFRFRDILDHDE